MLVAHSRRTAGTRCCLRREFAEILAYGGQENAHNSVVVESCVCSLDFLDSKHTHTRRLIFQTPRSI